jgi:hypothetical protein
MKRQIPGLHSGQQLTARHLEGMFLVRVDTASYRIPSPRGCTAASEHCGSSIGSFGTLPMTPNCSGKIKWTRKRF